VPDLVRARALYLAQVLHLKLQDALGAMLLDAVQRMDLADQEIAVRGVLNQYRIALTEDADRDVQQDV
jgi:hypothetical protein